MSADDLAGITLFADLNRSELVAVEQAFEEQHAEPGERLLREGYDGSGFYIVLSGEASVSRNGEPVYGSSSNGDRQPLMMRRGDWFGELSVLFGEPPVADVVASTPMQLVVLAPDELEGFLLRHPQIMLRLLKGVAWRARDPERWK